MHVRDSCSLCCQINSVNLLNANNKCHHFIQPAQVSSDALQDEYQTQKACLSPGFLDFHLCWLTLSQHGPAGLFTPSSVQHTNLLSLWNFRLQLPHTAKLSHKEMKLDRQSSRFSLWDTALERRVPFKRQRKLRPRGCGDSCPQSFLPPPSPACLEKSCPSSDGRLSLPASLLILLRASDAPKPRAHMIKKEH